MGCEWCCRRLYRERFSASVKGRDESYMLVSGQFEARDMQLSLHENPIVGGEVLHVPYAKSGLLRAHPS